MAEIENLIENSKALTDIFGYWPSFHDAEVIDLQLWRGRVEPEKNLYQFPVLTIQFHLWEITNQVDTRGILVMRHHTLATLRFHDVEEDIELFGFNHQNAIFGLDLKHCQRSTGPTPYFEIEMSPAHGLGASFKCLRIEVLDCKACDEDGNSQV